MYNMKLNNKNINVDDAINFADYQQLLLKRRKNNMLLSDYQVNVLENNGINYNDYSNLSELLFGIDSILENYYQEELELVAMEISELLYYSESKK